MKQLTPYEQTQLARYGNNSRYSPEQIAALPIEYVTETAEFCGLPFRVTEDVLIPRVETEELVELALQAVGEKLANAHVAAPCSIADIGTGSGALIVSIARHLDHFAPQLQFFASDISETALKVAQQNAASHLDVTRTKVTFLNSNLLTSYPAIKIDVLVANLPYIPSSRIAVLPDSVKNYEPHLALDGGRCGLDLIYTLLEQAPKFLKQNAVILLEIDETHSLPDFSPFSKNFVVEILQDSFQKNRFARVIYTQHSHTA